MEVGGRRRWAEKGRSPGIAKMQTIREIRLDGSAKKQSVETWLKDPETKRKRRVAKYKYYAVEGKVKRSIKKGFKWIKNRCAKFISAF